MQLRRNLLMQGSSVPDTSPKIVQYDKAWGRGINVVNELTDWGITDWFIIQQPISSATLVGYVGNNDSNTRTFQYYNATSTMSDWFYFNNGNQEGTRNLSRAFSICRISFSLYVQNIDNTYVYIQQTGEIIFAGKNTQYYGHRNINELS